jgi:hypothetical protein
MSAIESSTEVGRVDNYQVSQIEMGPSYRLVRAVSEQSSLKLDIYFSNTSPHLPVHNLTWPTDLGREAVIEAIQYAGDQVEKPEYYASGYNRSAHGATLDTVLDSVQEDLMMLRVEADEFAFGWEDLHPLLHGRSAVLGFNLQKEITSTEVNNPKVVAITEKYAPTSDQTPARLALDSLQKIFETYARARLVKTPKANE